MSNHAVAIDDVQSQTVAYLKTAAGVGARCNGRVFPDHFPQDVYRLCAVRVVLIDTEGLELLSGTSGDATTEIQVDVASPSRIEATNVGKAVKRAMLNHHGLIHHLPVKRVGRTVETASADPPADSSDRWRYTYTLRFRLNHCEVLDEIL